MMTMTPNILRKEHPINFFWLYYTPTYFWNYLVPLLFSLRWVIGSNFTIWALALRYQVVMVAEG